MKRGQEEIVGFAVIMVLVGVVFVVFLGIMLAKPGNDITNSKDINHFLLSTLQYTSDCAIGYQDRPNKIIDLIKECDNGLGVCENGENPCLVLNNTLKGIITSSFQIGEDRPIKGYIFDIEKERNESLLRFGEGNCTGSRKGGLLAYSGGMAKLTLCY